MDDLEWEKQEDEEVILMEISDNGGKMTNMRVNNNNNGWLLRSYLSTDEVYMLDNGYEPHAFNFPKECSLYTCPPATRPLAFPRPPCVPVYVSGKRSSSGSARMQTTRKSAQGWCMRKSTWSSTTCPCTWAFKLF
jgi:hypothetical protein